MPPRGVDCVESTASLRSNAMKVPCPVCKTSNEWEGNPFRPFCGERCRLLDLGNWADERYRIAGEPVSPDVDDEADGS